MIVNSENGTTVTILQWQKSCSARGVCWLNWQISTDLAVNLIILMRAQILMSA